jgi:hypothetical protein
MWLIDASGVCKVLLENLAINWRSSSIKLLELEKPLEETHWLAVVKRYVSVPCDPLKLVTSCRESWVFQDCKISATAEIYCNMQLLVILQSGYVHLSTWAIRLQYDHILWGQLRVPFFYSGHHLQRTQDKCENETHVVGSHITFLWSYLSATNREDKNARYDKQGERWMIGDCYQVTIPLLNM